MRGVVCAPNAWRGFHCSAVRLTDKRLDEKHLRFDSSKAFEDLNSIKGRKNILLDCLYLVREYDQNLKEQTKEWERVTEQKRIKLEDTAKATASS